MTNNYPIQLAAFTTVYNNAHDLNKWIMFHLAQGVQKFYIFDYCSTDGTQELLDPYKEIGIVTYKLFNEEVMNKLYSMVPKSHNKHEFLTTLHKYNFLPIIQDEVQWLMCADVKTFLHSDDQNLQKTLENYDLFGGLSINNKESLIQPRKIECIQGLSEMHPHLLSYKEGETVCLNNKTIQTIENTDEKIKNFEPIDIEDYVRYDDADILFTEYALTYELFKTTTTLDSGAVGKNDYYT